MPLLGEVMVMFSANTAGFNAGAGLVVGALAGIGVAIGKTVSMAGDFEAGITNLSTAAGESSKNLGMVGDGIKKVAVDTGTGTKDLTAAMFMIESSGAHGAAGLQELSVAARGARTDNAELMVVSKALTGVLAGWPQTTNGATGAMNELIAASSLGKMHLQDLSKAMGNVIPIAGAAGVSFADVGAAVAMMTNKNMTAQRASANVAFALRDLSSPSGIAQKAMKSVGLSAQDLSDTLSHKGLGATLQEITDAVGKTFPAGSIEARTALKNIMGGASGLNVALALGGKHLAEYEAGVKKVADAAKNGGQSVEGWSTVQGNFNTKLGQAKAAVEVLGINIGTALLPVLSRILGVVTPIIGAMANWASANLTASGMVALLKDHAQVIIPVLAGIGAIILAVLLPAMLSLAVAVIAATWPFVAIGLAVAGLVAIFMHFYSTSAPFKAFVDSLVSGLKTLASIITANVGPAFSQLGTFISGTVLPALSRLGTFISGTVWPILQQVGAFIASAFIPVWNQLVATFNGELLPAWHSLVTAIQPLLPTLKILAEFIGAVVATAVILLISVIGGLIHGLASLLSGLIEVFSGVVQIISGAIKIVTGIISFFVDLVTGRFDKLGGDIGTVMDGIGTVIAGVWTAIKGVFQAGIGFVVGFVKGFLDTIVGIFHNLSNMLVGHSIVPDMINAIVQFFATLPGRAVAAVIGIIAMVGNVFSNLATAARMKAQQLVLWVYNTLAELAGRAQTAIGQMSSTILGGLAGIAGQALQAGANIVEQIASGILGSIGSAIGGAMSAVGSFISSHLPASPAKMGPLRNLAQQGGEISHQISLGIMKGLPAVQASLNKLSISTDSLHVGTPAIGTPVQQTSSSNGTQTIIIQMDGRDVAKALGPHLTNEIRLVAQVRR